MPQYIMQILYEQFHQLLELTPMNFFREQHDTINWDVRILGILGQKGVGKSTLILQHIKRTGNKNESLYVIADDIYFSAHTLLDTAKSFFARGGKYLYIDEIHKYPGWSQEVKNIYDSLPLLHVVYSGSSILDLKEGGADLSRRVIEYHLPVWSFREYLNLRNGWSLKPASLEDVLQGKVDFPYGAERPLKYFEEYMKKGCYPFFQEPEFETRMRQVINTTVEVDIPKYARMTIAATQKLKKFMYYISKSVPVKILGYGKRLGIKSRRTSQVSGISGKSRTCFCPAYEGQRGRNSPQNGQALSPEFQYVLCPFGRKSGHGECPRDYLLLLDQAEVRYGRISCFRF